MKSPHLPVLSSVATLLLCTSIGAQESQPQDTPEPGSAWQQHIQAEQSAGEVPAEKTFLHLNHVLGASYGQLAAIHKGDAFLKWKFFPNSDNLILKDAHFAAGLHSQLTPAYFLFGPSVTIAPLTILRLNVTFAHVSNGFLANRLAFLDYTERGQFSDYSYAYRNDNGDDFGFANSEIWTLFLRPTFLFKVSNFILVYSGEYMYFHPTNFQGLYYNYIADMVLAHDSWCLMNNLYLLWQFASVEEDGWGLNVGLSQKFYAALAAGSTTSMQNGFRYLVGPMVTYTFAPDWFGVVKKPTLLSQLHYIPVDALDPAAVGQLGEPRVINFVLALRFSTPLQ